MPMLLYDRQTNQYFDPATKTSYRADEIKILTGKEMDDIKPDGAIVWPLDGSRTSTGSLDSRSTRLFNDGTEYPAPIF